MKNHTLMQTIARANRVWGDKKSGLIVDYVGVFRNLEKALAISGDGVPLFGAVQATWNLLERSAGKMLEAAHAVVFEDALAGVQAGRSGDFGYVVGVDRVGQADALKEHGADVVVSDLAELLS